MRIKILTIRTLLTIRILLTKEKCSKIEKKRFLLPLLHLILTELDQACFCGNFMYLAKFIAK